MSIAELAGLAASTMPLWQRPVIAALALFVIGCIQFYASAIDG